MFFSHSGERANFAAKIPYTLPPKKKASLEGKLLIKLELVIRVKVVRSLLLPTSHLVTQREGLMRVHLRLIQRRPSPWDSPAPLTPTLPPTKKQATPAIT
jgi:hypothetical protein